MMKIADLGISDMKTEVLNLLDLFHQQKEDEFFKMRMMTRSIDGFKTWDRFLFAQHKTEKENPTKPPPKTWIDTLSKDLTEQFESALNGVDTDAIEEEDAMQQQLNNYELSLKDR